MSDKVIKNPERTNIPRVQTPYEPNYIRLGKEVIVSGGKKTNTQSNVVDDININEMYAGVDGDIIDENGNIQPASLNGHIIDNNDYINYDFKAPVELPPKIIIPETLSDKNKSPTSPNIGEYVLMVLGKLIESGPRNLIEARLKSIMYGEDKSFSDLQIGSNDIVVLKRVNIKVGVFIAD